MLSFVAGLLLMAVGSAMLVFASLYLN